MVQAWGVLEAGEGNIQLARQLFKCAVKADSTSEASWLVSPFHPLHFAPLLGAAEGELQTPDMASGMLNSGGYTRSEHRMNVAVYHDLGTPQQLSYAPHG